MQAGSFLLSNALPVISAVSGIAGGVAAYNQGVDAQNVYNQQASDLAAQAKQERAVSYLQMARQQQEAKARASSTQASLASSGFATTDPSSVSNAVNTAGTETLEQLMTKALAEQRAKEMERQASTYRVQGKQARQAGTLSALAQIGGSAVSWADKYGKGIWGGADAAAGKQQLMGNLVAGTP